MAGKLVPPNSVKSLNARIANLARDHGIASNLLHHQIASYVVTEMLQRPRSAASGSLFLIKGGTAIQMRLGLSAARFSKDLDAVFRGSVDQMFSAAKTALADEWNGFTATAARPNPINVPGMAVKPMRFEVHLNYRGRSFANVRVELSAAEASSADEADTIAPAAFANVGMEALGLPDTGDASLLPLEYQIAQKLHACTDPGEPTRDNERAHDVVDLLLLQPLLSDEHYAATRCACVEIFSSRSRQQWPPTFVVYANWQRLYTNAVGDILDPPDVPASIEAAVGLLATFIDRLERSQS